MAKVPSPKGPPSKVWPSAQDTAQFVGASLDTRYPRIDIPLDHSDPFTLLVAVVLSAQTTDKRVNLVTPALFKRAGTPLKMAALEVAEIKSFIQTCGLSPQKAKALKGLAQQLLDRHGGKVPQSFEELEALPGVGHKTASVVMSQAFGVPAFPVDTHIHRLAYRWGLSSGKSVTQTERDLKSLFPESSWNKLHLQIIYYGREYCTARGCDGQTGTKSCPICNALKLWKKSKKPPAPLVFTP